ncbi:hypothetical protein ACIO02_23150 [Streptomyces sp. NPDC087568]|uniref:hypothetical protein n=1 Tax=Streptomyces sp. NPDC087568 TaxID=3365799 RepID=UPI0038241A3E
MSSGRAGQAVAVPAVGFRRGHSLPGMRLGADVGLLACALRRREGAQNVDKVQELPELAPRFVQVADHPVLAPAYLSVLFPEAGDASLDLLQDLQAALREVPV